MKSSVERSSSSSQSSFYTYLKPGALAKLRYTKITARSKEIGAQTLLALCQLQMESDPAFSQQNSMDRIPCFNVRVSSYTRCLQRRKFIAATRPFFSETQS